MCVGLTDLHHAVWLALDGVAFGIEPAEPGVHALDVLHRLVLTHHPVVTLDHLSIKGDARACERPMMTGQCVSVWPFGESDLAARARRHSSVCRPGLRTEWRSESS